MRLCTTPGCTQEARGSRCPEHTRQANRRKYRWLYGSRKWKFTRRRKLFETPLCEHLGCGHLAVDVHHAGGYDDPYDLAGLQALCKRHHGEITRAEQLGRAAA